MNKEIKTANMPSRPPIYPTLIVWMALDHWHAPLWLYGALGMLFLLVWVAMIYAMSVNEAVDIIERVEALEKRLNASQSRL